MQQAPVSIKQISLAADTTFGFDSAQLRPEGRARLDQLLGELSEVELINISIVGYIAALKLPSSPSNHFPRQAAKDPPTGPSSCRTCAYQLRDAG